MDRGGVGHPARTRWWHEVHDGVVQVVHEGTLEFNDDKEGKPLGISQHISLRPIAAFGNSDGDLQMLQ